MDVEGNTYSVTVVPGSVTVGGTPSIADVQPGGGILPAGTVVKITGTGFEAASMLTVDGVSVATFQVVSAQEIDFTIGAPVEMTGKRVALANPDGSQAEYFPLLPGVAPDGTLYVFPLRTGTSVGAGPAVGPVVQNPNLFPIDIVIAPDTAGIAPAGPPTTLAPGQVMSVPGAGNDADNLVISSGPMRDSVGAFSMIPGIPVLLPLFVDFAATPGSSGILTQTVPLTIDYGLPVNPPSISFVTESGGNWLSVSQSQTNSGARLIINADPSGLAPGTYLGTITCTVSSSVAPSATGSATAVVRLDITIGGSPQPLIVASPSSLNVNVGVGAEYTGGVSAGGGGGLSLDSGSIAIPFQGMATTSDGGNWLSTNDDSGVTPAGLYVRVEPSNLPLGVYQGSLLITSASQSLTVPVTLNIVPPEPPPAGPPAIGSIVNAASAALTSVSPGEVITIYGT